MTFQPIHLYPLSKTDAKTFIKETLKKSQVITISKNPFAPFTDDAIELLVDSQCPISPRRLLRVCSLIFETAEIADKKVIDKEIVYDVISKFGQISLVDNSETERIDKVELSETKSSYPQIIELSADGSINLALDPKKVNCKEVIGVILYGVASPINLKKLTDFVSRNWKGVSIEYVSANLQNMKGLFLRTGKKGEYA